MPGGPKTHNEGCKCRACSSRRPGDKVLISVRMPIDAVNILRLLKDKGFSQSELLDASWAYTYDQIYDFEELKQIIERFCDENNRPF